MSVMKKKGMPTADFRKLVKSRVDDEVSKCLTSIQQKIVDNKLQGHNFYIYVLPFTDINSKRRKRERKVFIWEKMIT